MVSDTMKNVTVTKIDQSMQLNQQEYERCRDPIVKGHNLTSLLF